MTGSDVSNVVLDLLCQEWMVRHVEGDVLTYRFSDK